MFGDADAGAGGEECSGGRDVEGRHGAAACAARIDEFFGALGADRDHGGAQCANAAGDLGGLFAFCAQRNEESGGEDRSSAALHDGAEGDLGSVGVEMFASNEPREKLCQGRSL